MGIIISYYCLGKNKNKNSSVPTLPQELIHAEILNRLPVKSLVRLQCVCKSWQSLISSNSQFLKSHLIQVARDPNNDYCVLFMYPRNSVSDTKGHPLLSKYLRIVGSVNGLVCIYLYDNILKSLPYFGIWNPVTNMYKNIPAPSTAFDIDLGNVSVGFGYDPISNDYKVIFARTIRYSPLVADVYSCNSESWGKTNVISSFVSTHCVDIDPTIVNGCPYWANMEQNYVNSFVISFNIRDEVFKLLPGPDFINVFDYNCSIVNFRDSLGAVVYETEKVSKLVDVYVFEEINGGTWSKKYSVGPIDMDFIQCFKNGDLLFRDYVKFKLISLNGLESCIHPFDASDFNQSFSGDSAAYTETLVSVNGMKQIQFNTGDDIVIIGQ